MRMSIHLCFPEQQEQYQAMGFSEDEAEDLILRQSNLTCGTMQGPKSPVD